MASSERSKVRPAARFQDCVCFNFRWFNRVLTQRYDEALRPFGLRATQLPILARLAAGPVAMAELADWLAMERTTLLRNLQPLLREGLVVSGRAEGRRGLELGISAGGRALLARAEPAWAEAQAEATAALGGAAKWRALLSEFEQAGERLVAS